MVYSNSHIHASYIVRARVDRVVAVECHLGVGQGMEQFLQVERSLHLFERS